MSQENTFDSVYLIKLKPTYKFGEKKATAGVFLWISRNFVEKVLL